MVNTHPNICVPPETSAFALLHCKYSKVSNWNDKTSREFVRNLFLDDKIPSWWKIRKKEFRSFLLQHYPTNFKQAIFHLYRFYAKKTGKSGALLGDKNPSNSLYIRQILSVFPKAKIIVIVRNPVDNVFSFTNVSFDSDNYKVLAHRWNYYNQELLKWKKLKERQIKVIRFEDYIENTEEIFKDVTAFLETDFQFDFENKKGGDKSWQKNLGSGISTEHTNKGLKHFNENQIRYIEEVCHDTAAELGYKLSAPSRSHFHLFAWLFNRTEKYFVKLPLYLSSFILRKYRKKKNLLD